MNIELWLAMVILIVVALVIIFPPLWRKRHAPKSDVDQQNIAIARQKMAELKQQLQTGTIDRQEFDAQLLELETALNDDLQLSQVAMGAEKQGRWVMAVIAIVLPLVVITMYRWLGNPDALNQGKIQQAVKTQTNGEKKRLGSVANMAQGLAERLKKQPDDVQGWIMLGKSYKYMKQYAKAVQAFEKANVLSGDQADVMLLYADALVMENNGRFTDKARTLIFKALEFTPNDITGLWLAGMAEAGQGNFSEALKYLQKVETLAPAGSDTQREVKVLIAKLKKRIDGDNGGGVAMGAQGNAPLKPTAGAVSDMVSALEQRLKKNPDDLQGWIMLGKSYKFLKQYNKAVSAFRKANVMSGEQADVMLLYADALVMDNGGRFTDEAKALIFRSLAIAADDATGLWLAGKAKVQEGAYQEALGYLRKAANQVQAGSESHNELLEYIADIETHLPNAAVSVAKPPEPELTEVRDQTSTIASEATIQVRVSLLPALQGRADANDTLFIYARALSGPQMPLAIVRKQVKDLPVIVSLTDEQAMTPMMKLSKFQQVNLTARISKSGNAMKQAGDLIGGVDKVNVTGQGLIEINIDRIIN